MIAGFREGISGGKHERGFRFFRRVRKKRVGKQHITFVMTRVVGIGMVSTATCVAVLSAGMFATIILLIWNRRVTLRQINANLMQISGQLKELQLREDKR